MTLADSPLPTPAPAASNAEPFSVSELAGMLKRTLEDRFGYVRLRGEVSKVTRHASGHTYLSIKDDRACIDGVIWKSVRGIAVRPEMGMEVVVSGKITTYPARSSYQLVIETLEPAGVGALLAQLEKLKAKLQAEGLFDPERKRPLPELPAVIGVVTSPTGAVIRDILHRLKERWPCRVVVWPVVVQSEAASAQVAAAVRGFAALPAGGGPLPRPDLLIVARGGGSVEDLWPFNDEALARTVAACPIPVISAVGHETDTTLIDFVSDRRAPTPTAAAEIATPVFAELQGFVADCERRMRNCTRHVLERARERLRAAERGLPRPEALLGEASQRLDLAARALAVGLTHNVAAHERELARASGRLNASVLTRALGLRGERLEPLPLRMEAAMRRRLERASERLDALEARRRSADPDAPLARGFARVSREDGRLVRAGGELHDGERISLKFRNDKINAVVENQVQAARPKVAPKAKPARDILSNQGDLF